MAITMKLVSFVCFFICTGFAVAAAITTRCCEPGYYMNENSTLGEVYCRNNITKVVKPSTLNCSNFSAMFNENQLFFNVSDEGDFIIWQAWGPEVKAGFCVGEVSLKLKGQNKFILRRAAATCFGGFGEPLVDHMATLYCSLLSVVFLYATAAIYAAMPELRDVEGKSVINLCASLATGLLIISVQNLTYGSLESAHCWMQAFSAYFFVIAAFFWMNVISFQILRNLRRPTIPKYTWKEFLWYFVYAWGLAAALTALIVLLDAVEGPHVKPGIGRTSCWFYSKKEIWMYLYSVLLVLIIVNTAIFVYISITICRSTITSDHMRAWRYKSCMMLRLYVIMGVPWILEMISGSVQDNTITSIFDLMNSLTGLLIFLVLVVLRVRVIKALQRRGLLCCMSGFAERFIADKDDHEARTIAHSAVMSLDETQFK